MLILRAFAALVACALLAPSAALADAGDRIRVAILPMVVHAQEDQDYLRNGIGDMLTARIGQSQEVAVIRVRESEKATTDPAVARQIAEENAAEFVVYGSFTSFGQGASLDARCLAVHGTGPDAERAVFVQAATLGEIIPKIDELATKVVNHVVESEFGVPDVASAPPAASTAMVVAPDAAANLEAEIRGLRERVEKLEAIVGGAAGAP